jgi:Proteasome stabiliser
VQVSRQADTLLRRKCGLDSATPAVNPEGVQLVRRIFHLIIGSPELLMPAAAAAATAAERKTWRQPASHALQIRLLRVLCSSKAACNAAPLTLQVRCCIRSWMPPICCASIPCLTTLSHPRAHSNCRSSPSCW